MTPRNLRNIRTTASSCRDALPSANMAMKLPQYFYLLMEELEKIGNWFKANKLSLNIKQKSKYMLFHKNSIKDDLSLKLPDLNKANNEIVKKKSLWAKM